MNLDHEDKQNSRSIPEPDPHSGQNQRSLSSYLPLNSERLILDGLQEQDHPALATFFRDMATQYLYQPSLAYPPDDAQLTRIIADWNDGEHHFMFAIRVDGALAGFVNLFDLDWPSSHAEVGVALTEARFKGRGLAREALRLLIDFAFMELGLHRIRARVIAANQPSMNLFLNLGFKAEGVAREHVRRNGQFQDMHFFGLLRDEWPPVSAPASSLAACAKPVLR